MRRKTIQEVINPSSPQDTISGITRCLQHAARMHGGGKLSDAEREDLVKLAMHSFNPGKRRCAALIKRAHYRTF